MAYIPSSPNEAEFLKNYDPTKYQNPAVAADTAVFAIDRDAIKILLIRRGGYPYKGCWALPGGYVNIDEDIYDTAKRELLEETGLSGLYIEQVFTWAKPDRDPRYRTITASYVTLANITALKPRAGDDASDAAWFTLKDYTKIDADGVTTVHYTLEGPDSLESVVAYPSGRIQQIYAVERAGLAFDHAESIVYSYEYLARRAQTGFLELALEDDKLIERARKILLHD